MEVSVYIGFLDIYIPYTVLYIRYLAVRGFLVWYNLNFCVCVSGIKIEGEAKLAFYGLVLFVYG